jgi:hypothetical protein
MPRVSMPIGTAVSTAVALVPTWVWAQGPSRLTSMLWSAHDVVGREGGKA